MYKNKRPFAKGNDSDSEDSPAKFNKRLTVPKQQPVDSGSPTASKPAEPDSLNLDGLDFDKEIRNFDALATFCKNQFKDVYSLFGRAKNRIIKVEGATEALTHRLDGVSHACNQMVQKVELHGLRIEKLEKYRMQDLQDIDMRFGMQKKSLEEVEFKLEAIKEQMGEYLPKAEFYALSGAFVQEDRFKFFEEAVEVNYLPRTRIMKEIESLWVEVKNSKEYVSSNFLSAKEQKQMLERKLEASKANYVEAKRFKKYENQIATQLASHTTRLDSFPDQLDELHERMKVVTKKLERKANEDELQQTVEYMRQLPQNKDLVELYNKTVPQLGIFQKIVTQYSADQRRFERVILRFDEDISLKASKMSLRELSKHVEDKYLLQTEIEKSED